MKSNSSDTTRFGGFFVNAGVLYRVELGRNTYLRLGANGSIQNKLTAYRDIARSTFDFSTGAGIVVIDSVYKANDQKGEIVYPASVGFGHAGGHRHRERTAVQRDEGGAGAADRHRRGAAGHQQLGGRHPPGVREDPRQLPAPDRMQRPGSLDRRRGLHGAPGSDARTGRPAGRAEIQADSHRPDDHRGGGAEAPRDALSRRIIGGPGSRGDSPHGGQDRQFFLPGRADDVEGKWCRRLLRRPHVRGPPVDDVHGAGDRPAGNVRRPGGDRDSECPPVQGRPGSARRRRGRQRGQERVPRHDEPRDPHADERRHRHERAPAGHAARRRAAATTRPPSATRATRC